MPRTIRSRFIRSLSYALAMVLTLLPAGVAGLVPGAVSDMRSGTSLPPFIDALRMPLVHNADKRTAVVIAANSGTAGSDFLAPYAVLAHSGAFNLYAVAPDKGRALRQNNSWHYSLSALVS